MNNTTAGLIALGILAVIFVIFFALFRTKGKGKIKAPFGLGLEVEGSNDPAIPGIRVKDAHAGGDLRASDTTGHGVEVEKVKASGNIDLSSSSPGGSSTPKS